MFYVLKRVCLTNGLSFRGCRATIIIAAWRNASILAECYTMPPPSTSIPSIT